MSLYKAIKESVRNESPELRRTRLAQWRRSLAVDRINRPTNLSKARSLGYRAKQGIILARVRVLRGGRQRPIMKGGRRTRTRRRKKILGMNYQQICEQRANKKFINCEVLNSYYANEDGRFIWYEVILIDKSHPAILRDHKLQWITEPQHTGRAFRGLTHAGDRARGFTYKGKGTEKLRPSRAAVIRHKRRRTGM